MSSRCWFSQIFRKETMASGHKDLDFEQLRKGLQDNSLIYLDVRNHSELASDGKVAGSFVIPLPEIESAFTQDDETFLASYGFQKPSKDASRVVLACRSGRRVEQAVETLDKLGYNSLSTYKGSFLDWKAKGGDIVFN